MTSAEAADRIMEITGVSRSAQQVRAFMKRHKLGFIRCGHIPAKADNGKQHQRVETELKHVIEATQNEEVHLSFYDVAHFVLQPFLCSLWCAFPVFIKASAGRNRINVLGAVHAVTKEVTTVTNTTCITSTTLIDFLNYLKKSTPISLLQSRLTMPGINIAF